MPSTILGNPFASGAQTVISGNPWSGVPGVQGGIQLRWSKAASGFCYVGFSGAMTYGSGGMFLSGGGLLDGIELVPGDAYWVPREALPFSGTINIYAWCDAASSGLGRLYYEKF